MTVELAVIAGGAIPASLNELATRFEKASGHTLAIRYGTTPVLIRMATSSPFDVGIVPREVFRDAGPPRRGSRPDRRPTSRVSGSASRCVRARPKPDIATEAALRQTLLAARSLATVPASAGGMQALAPVRAARHCRRR